MLSPLPLLLGLSPSALPLLLGLSPCAALLAGAERVPPPSLATAVLQPLVLCLRSDYGPLSALTAWGPVLERVWHRLILASSCLAGQFCVTRRRCVKGPSSHYLYPMRSLPFSTAAGGETHEENSEQKEKITVTFVDKDGEEKVIQVPIGMSMLEAAHENDIELEGACEGSLACSTCHVIVMDMEYYNKLEDPADEENDMLDLAFGLTETSRLGCQVIAKPELDGIRLALPAATRNFAVDGFVPKPH